MLNLKSRFAWAVVYLWVAFSFWHLVIAVKPSNAAGQDCTTNGCYKNTCIVSGTTIYSIANAQLGATCANIYPDNTGNNLTCTGQVAGDFYQAKGTIACNPAGQRYGTAPGCTKAGDSPQQFYCCTSDCKAKTSG
jgi:hypothetical protein